MGTHSKYHTSTFTFIPDFNHNFYSSSKYINITTKWPHQANLHHHTMHPLGQIPPATPTTSKSPTQEMASRHTTEGLWKTNSATFLKVGLANMTNKAIINSSSIPGPTPPPTSKPRAAATTSTAQARTLHSQPETI